MGKSACHNMPVSCEALAGTDEIHVSSTRIDLLFAKSCTDFGKLESDDLILRITIRVILSHDVQSFFAPIVTDQPSRAFGKEV